MRVDFIDVWLANIGYGGYAVLAFAVKQITDSTPDFIGLSISLATILGGLMLAWYNGEKAWTTRKDRIRKEREDKKREDSKGD